ncbi:septum formation initiator family protein [Bariatricus massiliensis]|uniref:Septum formation initiator family protein n=1 Tax=Bariatricus massiliensis TaxID=1745713 RepID=A0ABS8DKJ8_9FIRM|nr:septum formation initiator family protein [Bariatricus massiliensis]MCB7305805.1 septum formation initiator family protein [Bariatricus massiliensis]MCB7376278.1 septum formation initiator family protein [Bariatricus massiliensis]MCB7388948.1 septum formation initiator family protein [Bariatricus massiliensis]MCB7413121.1 septum formation initiator family protein [Bariatricus massiliensis]MCQ5254934.1 septum formation initiator family protein [Bariatricus massiliensis]
MGSIKQVKGRKQRPKSRLRHHKRSVAAISGVIALMAVMVLFGGMKLQARNRAYKVQEAELQAQLDDEKERSAEIDELKDYVGTDKYIEEVAKEKLGLVHENEILFKPEQ